MEWWSVLLIIFGSLLGLMLIGLPVAFSFMLINLIGVFIIWGVSGFQQLILSIFESITFFALLPVPLFLLMGEVLFRSGMGTRMIDALDVLLGRLPGRLSLIAVAGGVLNGVLSGNSWASTAMLGSLLAPEMEKRGYKKSMILGPIMGSGGLAAIIPPSGLAVVLATLAKVSVGELLIAGLLPGLVMGALFAVYIIGICKIRPELAPTYEVPKLRLVERLMPTVKYVLPLGIIVFAVIGLMLLGWATPTESAVFGVLATFVLSAVYRKLNWQIVEQTFASVLINTTMIFIIFCSSTAFSQILAFLGATKGMVELAVNLPIPPLALLFCIMIVLLILGMFMDQMSIMMITLPILMPVCHALKWNPIWFCLLILINLTIANISPPFGIQLFVMKGVSSPSTTMGDVYRAAIPFVILEVTAIVLIIFCPSLATWLPNILK
jgi:tripartite ATP-independent transporter DctM subunit